MSRHRAVRNLDLDDELDDSPMDDDYEEEYPGITLEQQEQMVNGLGSVRAVLGSEAGGGLSDKDIKDSLWYYYFDVEKTVEYLLDQQHKKNAAKEKGEQCAILPPTSGSCARPSPKPDFDIATTQSDGEHAAIDPAHAAAQHTAGMEGVVHELAQDTGRMAIGSSVASSAESYTEAGAGSGRTSAGPGKTSLASLAAASKAAKPSLASLAKAKASPAAPNGNGAGMASPSLSKLAAKAQSRQNTGSTILSGIRASQPSSSPPAHGASDNGAPTAATNAPKLSKLQQRILAGGAKPAASAPHAHPDASAAPMDEVEEDQLPQSSLFAGSAPTAPPSGFASALIPEHHPAFDAARARDLASRERTKGIATFDKPSPDDLAIQSKKAGGVPGRGVSAKR